jgi:hypothetical protein
MRNLAWDSHVGSYASIDDAAHGRIVPCVTMANVRSVNEVAVEQL